MLSYIKQAIKFARVYLSVTRKDMEIYSSIDECEVDLKNLTDEDLQFQNDPPSVSFDIIDDKPAPETETENVSTVIPKSLVLKHDDKPASVPVEPSLVDSNELVLVDSNELVLVDSNELVLADDNELVLVDSNELVLVDCNELVLADSNELVLVDSNELVLAVDNELVLAGDVFGLAPSELANLTRERVRELFREAVFSYHPDRNSSSTTDQMQLIYDAREILLATCDGNIPVIEKDTTPVALIANVVPLACTKIDAIVPQITSDIAIKNEAAIEIAQTNVPQITSDIALSSPKTATGTKLLASREALQSLQLQKREASLGFHAKKSTDLEEDVDEICTGLEKLKISEPVEEISNQLASIKISDGSDEAIVAMECDDPMDWNGWEPKDEEMGGESAHLKRSGLYLIFEQRPEKRRKIFGDEPNAVPMECDDPMDWNGWEPKDEEMGGESAHLKRSGLYLIFEQRPEKRRKIFGDEPNAVPMECDDPMDWNGWEPKDEEMGGESAHLKRSGLYQIFEQRPSKRRKRT